VPVRVTLIDAQARSPVVDASLNPMYRYFLNPFHPDVDRHTTDAGGTAVVPIAVSRSGLPIASFDGLWLDKLALDSPETVIYVKIPDEVFLQRKYEITLNVLRYDEWRERYKPEESKLKR